MSSWSRLVLAFLLPACLHAQLPPGLPVWAPPEPVRTPDCLLDPSPFVARAFAAAEGRELVLDNGLLRATFRVQPDLALVSLRQLVTDSEMLRAVEPCARLVIDGQPVALGGLLGQPDRAFLLPQWRDQLTADPSAFHLAGIEVGPIAPRLAWQRRRHSAPGVEWPPRGLDLRCTLLPPTANTALRGLRAVWHFELYDGLPLGGVWLELHNDGEAAPTLDRVCTFLLAAVEGDSTVDPLRTPGRLPDVIADTDYAFCAMSAVDANSQVVHWRPDPRYTTQVNYDLRTPCLLVLEPEVGPALRLAAGASFTSFHGFVLLPDNSDRDRRGLMQRAMYRTLAPWVTENPLMMHLRSAQPAVVREAIAQCGAVGFEMLILSFGSGFDVEDGSVANLAKWKELADEAHQQGLEIGGYSLLASRRIQPDGDNCIDRATGKPGGQRFGFAPALASGWGQRYFAQLRAFYEHTGFDLLEHDGSYPGDFDAMARPPLQQGYDDSQWVQWRIVTDWYRWCRARGIFLNVPDWYFLSGSNKTGMGYRETNWSLPRDLQVLHARQNLYDGTFGKTPSMGWMFVPLTEYHGGGAAATIEPLDQHRDHYQRMLVSNLGYGAQACYRGNRLYDTEATRQLVADQVAWFKAHRDILESDVIHGSSRRADGSDLDWVLHANARLPECAMLVVYNPTPNVRARPLRLSLYYAGVGDTVGATAADGGRQRLPVDADHCVTLPVRVEAGGSAWWSFRRAD